MEIIVVIISFLSTRNYVRYKKAYKFRLYPNHNQKELINKMFGCTRLVYNYYLESIVQKFRWEIIFTNKF